RDRDREGDRVREYIRRSRDRVRHQDYGGECGSNLDGLWVWISVSGSWIMEWVRVSMWGSVMLNKRVDIVYV
nr:hypothetical protein [Tanacetum cinerariifolium]